MYVHKNSINIINILLIYYNYIDWKFFFVKYDNSPLSPLSSINTRSSFRNFQVCENASKYPLHVELVDLKVNVCLSH